MKKEKKKGEQENRSFKTPQLLRHQWSSLSQGFLEFLVDIASIPSTLPFPQRGNGKRTSGFFLAQHKEGK